MSQADFGHYMECSLDLAVDLVNTENPVSGDDTLASLDGLIDFLTAHEVSSPGQPTETDLAEVRELRATLRRAFDAQDETATATILNDLLGGSGAKPVLTDHDGPWHLHYSPSGSPLAPRLAAEAAMALAVIIAQGDYERLQSCDADDCRDVYVDRSRNRSRRYCSPASCGNRASVAAYRARQRSGTAS
jgi:predicted RNA-binding Zn ribbon-like protein